jgi:phenylpropionate dioxygenase-like ring-hydroxylating dioxygenase large terminal subunit
VASRTHRRALEKLVDLKRGVISREIFVSEDIYQQEQEHIFAHSWLFVGHESQIPRPGDYFTSCMGEESVILTRDQQGVIHVFLNTCRHRGMKVCRYDEGNTTVFTCPYHGWSFATDGTLAGVPYYKEAYHGEIDRAQWGLIEVAQMANYKGTIWATWDKAAPAFLESLGGMRRYLDILLDCRDGRPGGSEVLGGVQKWYMPCNWKFAAENFAGDGYHNISHRSVDLVGIGPSGQGRRDNERLSTRSLNMAFPEHGHAALVFVQTADLPFIPTYQNVPVVQEYFQHVYEERQRRLGKEARLLGRVGTVFPNMSFLSRQPRSIAVWHPRGALKTEAWRWFLVDQDAPQEVKDFLRHYYMRYSGPGGLTEQDDMENWNYASAASKGVIARRYDYNYQMGLGFESADADLPGVMSEGYSEQNQRALYQRWATLMAGRDGAVSAPRRATTRSRPTNGRSPRHGR